MLSLPRGPRRVAAIQGGDHIALLERPKPRLWAFRDKLDTLGYSYTAYKNIEELKFKFGQQLDKLAAGGCIELKQDGAAPPSPAANSYQATGGGAIAQGPGATAVEQGGVYVGGNNHQYPQVREAGHCSLGLRPWS